MSECGRDEQRILFVAGEPSDDFADHLIRCGECADFVRDAEDLLRLTRRDSESPTPAVVDRIVERSLATVVERRGHRLISFARSALAASILAGVAILPWAMPNGGEVGRMDIRSFSHASEVAVDAEIRDLRSVAERAARTDVAAASSGDPVTDDMIANTRYAIARHAYTDDPIIDDAIANLRSRTEAIAVFFSF